MMETRDSHSFRRDLSAFTDGELDSAASERLLARLASDPKAAEALRQLQQLKGAARRAVRGQTPSPSDSLLERLGQMTGAEMSRVRSAPPSRPRTFGLWWAVLPRLAAAVVLLAIGIWVGRRMLPGAETVRQPSPNVFVADVLPASVISQAEEIHGFCSRLADGLHAAGYPEEIAPLAASVEKDLHSQHPYPDLGPIGFHYRGAGPCGKPLANTAHLLYKSVRPGSYKAVSVFVQAWRGQYPLEEGRLYTVSVATSPFPMLAWRTESVVYFLLADDADTVEKAAALIRGTQPINPAGPTSTAPSSPNEK
jgi:anti-sigma factor RsiW